MNQNQNKILNDEIVDVKVSSPFSLKALCLKNIIDRVLIERTVN